MEEKILIKSQKSKTKKVLGTFILIGIILAVILFAILVAIDYSWYSNAYDSMYEDYLAHQRSGQCGDPYSEEACVDCIHIWATSKTESLTERLYIPSMRFAIIPLILMFFIGLIIYLRLNSYELTVTNKRIYGKIASGKRVDLPVDSISSTAILRASKGISLATSSGSIRFLAIKNANEIYNVISKLIITRQKEKVIYPAVTMPSTIDEVDQLKKYKDLLDGGVITQEEFDAKKKQLLGI